MILEQLQLFQTELCYLFFFLKKGYLSIQQQYIPAVYAHTNTVHTHSQLIQFK